MGSVLLVGIIALFENKTKRGREIEQALARAKSRLSASSIMYLNLTCVRTKYLNKYTEFYVQNCRKVYNSNT